MAETTIAAKKLIQVQMSAQLMDTLVTAQAKKKYSAVCSPKKKYSVTITAVREV